MWLTDIALLRVANLIFAAAVLAYLITIRRKMTATRILVLLFTGVLVQRIYMATDAVAERHPGIEFIKAPYLNDHPAVIETFAERVREIIAGENLMNCQMCKYREQVLGFEADVGQPQESHHHHVEGVGSGCTLCDPDGTCNGRCQEQGKADHGHDHGHHHHHPYPHADHPLGPKSMKRDG